MNAARGGLTDWTMSSALIDSVVELRREIHAHPEPGFEEHETHRRLKQALVDLAGCEQLKQSGAQGQRKAEAD